MMAWLSLIVPHHMYAVPPYAYIATYYPTKLSLFTRHMWTKRFCVVGAAAHAAIFMIKAYCSTQNYDHVLHIVSRHRDTIISHLKWLCVFLEFHSFGLYLHNDTMRMLKRSQNMSSNMAILLQPIFAQLTQNIHTFAASNTSPSSLATANSALVAIVSVLKTKLL